MPWKLRGEALTYIFQTKLNRRNEVIRLKIWQIILYLIFF